MRYKGGKMARKRRDNSPVVTRVSPQVKALFAGLAASQGCTLSDVLRDALVYLCKTYGGPVGRLAGGE